MGTLVAVRGPFRLFRKTGGGPGFVAVGPTPNGLVVPVAKFQNMESGIRWMSTAQAPSAPLAL